MKLKNLIPSSAFCSIATITGSEESLEKAHGFIQYNQSVISRFENIIISFNYLDGVTEEQIIAYTKLWKDAFRLRDVHFIKHDHNPGHMMGVIALEESFLKYIDKNYTDIQYIWKSGEDVIIEPQILDRDIPEAEFYYLPGFSYETISGLNSISTPWWNDNTFMTDYKINVKTPQTNFYILDITKVESIYGDDVERKWNKYMEIHRTTVDRMHIKPWEMVTDDGIKFDCETHLGRGVMDLKRQCLLTDIEFKDLIKFVRDNRVGDPSHKNIMFKETGICHYHNWRDLVHII